ncbi:aldehyde ferredoxin oxidoreductase C-terminal domain-containing protein [Desulfosporosinus sp.]|uniref:aldehyde ferredoxin oxidoreductase C-terminal domain-containing protein n=1 Tax=Desulfosporosinus sp. TaxID=157907 RepID=UPI000E922663|nr:aldehyde ferredoxin oxidoreductase C-terminal domain-containing protein [Desulfosporosinus sp.]MBC2724014.1 aldehyde:ferredoxin oxidoreductase [Desulfosporosinus sp.]MBC2725488.1 aldehyde:ferredoxin oxidoreductase [Desulfosporosinus sp.]HBV88873.1 aldehyde:ferredoxin oxidoreductase [Desulfosporosinus sp.]
MFYEKTTKVLYIDLSTSKIEIKQRTDLSEFLGGVGLASKLLEETMRPELPPLASEQPMILAIGAISGIYPLITKTVAMFISPLTGELGESYAGGRLALALSMAGFDAVVIHGKAPRPSYIAIDGGNVTIKDARPIWGMDSDVVGQFLRDSGEASGKRSILRIGPAGEKMVKFASVCVDTYRHFGRLGLGALMGSKLLKAIIVTGDKTTKIKDFKDYFKTYQSIFKAVTDTDLMSKYHDLGTTINVKVINALGALPTKNLTVNRFEGADQISGEAFGEKNLVRKIACTGCPVGCIHIGQFRRKFDEGYDYESVSVAYDYELIYSLGTLLGISKTDDVLQLIEAVEKTGMDAISTGVALAWATESLMQGIVTETETLLPLTFGDTENYYKAILNLASRINPFYQTLGEGTRFAGAAYGGEEFALQVAGNEIPGYHTGYANLTGLTVGARHSHLCNAGYAVDQSIKTFDEKKAVASLFDEELERCLLNSLVICLFARKLYNRETVLKALQAAGYPLTDDHLTTIAKRIYSTKLQLKEKLGFDPRKVELPKRFFKTPSMHGPLDSSVVERMINHYAEKCSQLLAEKI